LSQAERQALTPRVLIQGSRDEATRSIPRRPDHVPATHPADHRIADQLWGILDKMTSSARPRRHLATSPFQPDPEPIIERYAIDDLVSHDSYGMGRVIQVEVAAVTVDFRAQTVRITSPFSKMSRL
jgi:hypothetical protein